MYRSLKILCKWLVAEEEKETKKEEGEDERGLYTYYSCVVPLRGTDSEDAARGKSRTAPGLTCE